MMVPLICPSPIILDHSFPQNLQDLEDVVGALGNIQQARDEKKLSIVASPVFPMFISDIDWQKVKEFPPLLDVYRYLTVTFLLPSTSYVEVDTDKLASAMPHPLPQGCVRTTLTDLWSDEVGKIKRLHDERMQAKPFIGIACHRGFSTGATGSYPDPQEAHLPLVGLNEYAQLAPGTRWDIDANIHNRSVSYDAALRNLRLLGGKVNKHSESSHTTVSFTGALRPWVLDKNIDPVSETHLRELPALTGLPSDYIRHTLVHGATPKEISLLS